MYPKPLSVIKENISPIEVGKYYLKVELSKLFASPTIRSEIDQTIEDLDEYSFWRLLEAMSLTFRLNGVFWTVSFSGYTWSEEEWDADDITFVPMRPSIDKISFSSEIEGNPIKFSDYLKKYFSEHPDDDPEELNQFRPDPKREIIYPTLFLVEEEGQKIQLIDGGNRLIANLMRGQETLTAFVARPNNEEGKVRIGDSTFWLLGRLYNKVDQNDKESVLKTIQLLVEQSSDGKNAIQKYWLENIKDPKLKLQLKKIFTD